MKICKAAIAVATCGLHCFPAEDINATDVYAKMAQVASMDGEGRRVWLDQVLRSGQLCTTAPDNIPLCCNCFQKYYGVPRSSYFRAKRRFRAGTTNFQHARKGLKKSSPKRKDAKTWIEGYSKTCGDVMPDTGEIHLPDYKKKFLYDKMVGAFEEMEINCPSYGTFLDILKQDLPGIKVRKLKRFAKCKVIVYTFDTTNYSMNTSSHLFRQTNYSTNTSSHTFGMTNYSMNTSSHLFRETNYSTNTSSHPFGMTNYSMNTSS